jgi:hypothetical protein
MVVNPALKSKGCCFKLENPEEERGGMSKRLKLKRKVADRKTTNCKPSSKTGRWKIRGVEQRK